MLDVIFFILSLLVAFSPIVLAIIVGPVLERMHLAQLDKDEAAVANVRLTTLKKVPEGASVEAMSLCRGSAVMAPDLLRFFFSGLRMLVGGEMKSLSRVMTRGRREALVRLRREALAKGCTMVINIRIDTVNVGLSKNNKQYPVMEIHAYGTGIRLRPRANA